MMNWIQLILSGQEGNFKKGPRSIFELDYDRLIFSRPFRLLQDKTQVFPLPKKEFVHNRLTHSLEVSSVGRSLGRIAGHHIVESNDGLKKSGISADDFGAIVAAASLAHDIGNPPFGHAGESGISDFFLHHPEGQRFKDFVSEKEWKDITTFEGNAQGFRLLNDIHNEGLKITNATKGAFTKYPCESLLKSRDKGKKSQKKYGFFQAEKDAFVLMAESLGLINQSHNAESITYSRHPLTFLVEAADDICYTIIDLEDGVNLGHVSYLEAYGLLEPIIVNKIDENKLRKIPHNKSKMSLLRALAIGQLIEQTAEAFMREEPNILNGNFDKALTDHIPSSKAIQDIQSLSVTKIYRAQPVLEKEAAGFEILSSLLISFAPPVLTATLNPNSLSWRQKNLLRLLPEELNFAIEQADGQVYYSTMALLDFISGLTDSFAVELLKTIKGINL